MDMQQALAHLVDHLDLSTEEMQQVMRTIMTGGATDAQIGAFLTALRMKSESLDEITGAALVMRELATKVDVSDCKYLVDIVGTGGDGANLFNVSTASAFVAAAAGCHVAKHGNRSVSSSSGAADLLQAAGISLELSPEEVARCIREVGVGFMFAPAHHGAMKHAIGPRKELGMRTIFNVLGPLTNPAGVTHLMMGVFSPELCRPMAEVLARLGAEQAMVVHGRDGLDEISLSAATKVAELRGGEVHEYDINPEDLGVESASRIGLEVTEAEASLELIRDALGPKKTEAGRKAADMITLNAGAAIHVSGITETLANGVRMAEDLVHNGEGLERLKELGRFTWAMKEQL